MNLGTIVSNMVSANEPESNIAMVIKAFKTAQDKKNKKSPLKLVEGECEEGFVKNPETGECVKKDQNQFPQVGKSSDGTPLKPATVGAGKIVNDPEKDYETWLIENSDATQEDIDNKRKELDLNQDRSPKANDRRAEEDNVQVEVLDEVVVTPPKDSAIIKRNQASINSVRPAIEEAFGEYKLSKQEMLKQQLKDFGGITNTTLQIALAFEGDTALDDQAILNEQKVINNAGNILNTVLAENPFIKAFPEWVIESNQEEINLANDSIKNKYNLDTLQMENYNRTIVTNQGYIDELKDELFAKSGIPFVEKDGVKYLAKGVDINSPQNKKRTAGVYKELNKTINNLANQALDNDQKYKVVVAQAEKEAADFQNNLIKEKAGQSTVYQEILTAAQEATQNELKERKETRLENQYGGIFGKLSEGAYETILATLPKAVQDFQMLDRGRTAQDLDREIERLKGGQYTRATKRVQLPEGELDGMNSWKDVPTGKISFTDEDGTPRTYDSLEAAIAIKSKKKFEAINEATADIIKSQKYQTEIANFDQPKVFDDDWLTMDDWKKILGTQAMQMMGAVLSLGGSTLVQEAGSAADEIIIQKAISNLGISLADFNKLPLNKQLEAKVAILESGEADLDTAMNIGIANAGLDLLGNFIVIGKAGKAIPKNFLGTALRKELATSYAKGTKPFMQNIGELAKTSYKNTIKPFGKNIAGAIVAEEATELTQEAISIGGVESAGQGNVFQELTSQNSVDRYLETAAQTFLSVGPITGGGQIITNTINILRANPDVNIDNFSNKVMAQYEINKNKIYENPELSPERKARQIEALNTKLELASDNIEATKLFFNSTKLKDLKGEQAAMAIDAISKAIPIEEKMNILKEKIKGEPDGTLQKIELEGELKSLDEKYKALSTTMLFQRAVSLTEEQGKAFANTVNKTKDGFLADKRVEIFQTREEAKTFIEKNYKKSIKNKKVTGLLDGQKDKDGKVIFNNAIKLGNSAIIVTENQVVNMKDGDFAAGNAINHEVMHFITDGMSLQELGPVIKGVMGELSTSKDPKMKAVYKETAARLRGYVKDGASEEEFASEFFSALSDTMKNIEIKDIALEDVGALQKIGNFFMGAASKEFPQVLDFGKMDASNTLEFIQRYNNFDKGAVSAMKPSIGPTQRPSTLASKPLDEKQIEIQIKEFPKGEMTDEFATQVAYAYEPLANSIANSIYRNYPEFAEQGYKVEDFAMDIAFGDPKDIGGKNSLVEIAKSFDPANTEGTTIGGWLKPIAQERAKRIADVRIGKSRTTGAQSLDVKESVDIKADEKVIESVIPIIEQLKLPTTIVKQIDNAIAAGILNADNKVKAIGKKGGTQKQKIAGRDKAVEEIILNQIQKPLKKELLKDIGKNWKPIGDAFIKNTNINKISNLETRSIIQGWKDNGFTKADITKYFNDPSVAANTRSDRKNVGIVNSIIKDVAAEARAKFKANPENKSTVEAFEADNEIVLASRFFPGLKSNNKKEERAATAKYANMLAKMVKEPEYKKTLFNKSSLAASGKVYFEGFRQFFNELLEKNNVNFKDGEDGESKYVKSKASIAVGGNVSKIENSVKEGKVEEFNKDRGILFDETINFLYALSKKPKYKNNPDFKDTVGTILHVASDERSGFLGAGAKLDSYDPKVKEGIVWEHAIPVKEAGKVIYNALFDLDKSYPGKTFEQVITELKKKYKQIAFSKEDNNKINKGLGGEKKAKAGMPFVDGKPWDLFKDKETARYDQIEGLDLSKLTKFDLKSSVLASKPLSQEFNKMLERTKGIGYENIYSDARAAKLGIKKGFKVFVPYGAEDFLGLVYPTLGKGEQGNADLKWWTENVMDPYNDGMTLFESAKQASMLEWANLKKEIKNTPVNLSKEAVRDFTNEEAVRIYLWEQKGVTPEGLAKKDINALVKHVTKTPGLKEFADQIGNLTEDGYPSPTGDWMVGSVTTDLINHVNTVTRKEFLQPWETAISEIYTKDNKNKLRVAYGDRYVEALEDVLYRMKTGRNRPSGANRLTNNWLNWVNDSVGTIMFFNQRSALLQTISSINFINWSDNNPAKAAIAFGNQPQFWSDFSYLFNSDFLKQRRSGLKTDVNADEIAQSAAASTNKVRAAASWLLKKGFLPTQIADSFAIALGGSTFYRNRVESLIDSGMSKADAEKQAFSDFRNSANESQQSSDPSRISAQQASPLGRVILAFANTPIQYTRLTKRAVQDLAAGRGDWKTNVSKIAYYGAVQNIIFTALQQAMFGMLFSDEDDEFQNDKKDKAVFNVANSTADMFLRGSGVGGAFLAMLKNMGLEAYKQSNKKRPDYERVADKLFTFSPAIDTKFRKLQSAGRTFTYKQELEKIREKGGSIDNPAFTAIAKTISAFTNIPIDRILKKLNNIKTATEQETKAWQSMALLMGWGEWELGIQDAKTKKREEEKAITKDLQKSIDKTKKKKDKEKAKAEALKEKEDEKNNPLKAVLQSGTLGQANKDGSIDVKEGLTESKRKEVIAHEKKHQQEIKSGKLDYDDGFVYYGKKKFERKNGQIAYNGNWKPEGDHTLPWEKFAHNHKSKTT